MAKTLTVVFDRERCKGCALCAAFCPRQLIQLAPEINAFGYHPAGLTDVGKCTGCGLCARMCPDVAITIEKGDAA